MPGRGRRTARGRGRGSSNRGRISRRYLHNVIRGQKIKVKSDPPSIVFRPFYNLVLRIQGKGTSKITDSIVISGIKKQLGFDTFASQNLLVFKLVEARCWCEVTLNDPLKAPFQVDFKSVFGEGWTSVQTDFGTQINYHKLGFRWPASDQVVVLGANPTDDQLLVVRPVDLSANWIVDVHLMWSIDDGSVFLEDGQIRFRDGTTVSTSSMTELSHSFDSLSVTN